MCICFLQYPFHSLLQLFPALPNAGLSQAPKVDVPRDNWSHSEMRIASSVITQVGIYCALVLIHPLASVRCFIPRFIFKDINDVYI